MATSIVEQVSGELVSGKSVHAVRLKLTVEESWDEKSTEPIRREITDIEPVSLTGVAEGAYTLRFKFDGKQEEHPVRIQFGFMLADG